jgi:hypothetical protein
MIDHLTTWILKAFSAFAPKRAGGRTGAAFFERRIGPIQPLPLYNFSPTSENFFSFLPRPATCDLRPTAFLGAVPKIAYLWSSPKSFCPSLDSFSSSPKRFWSSLESFSSYLTSFSPSPARFCPHPAKGVFVPCLPRVLAGSERDGRVAKTLASTLANLKP